MYWSIFWKMNRYGLIGLSSKSAFNLKCILFRLNLAMNDWFFLRLNKSLVKRF